MSQKLIDLIQKRKFYFVTKSGSFADASKNLKHSFKIITDFSSSTENLQWLSEAECLSFDAQTLTKENVFILEEFEGESFDRLSSTKAIVIGPRVLINCQLTNDVVPNISSPIYTLAMKDFIVCLSGIGAEKRAEIRKLVGYMGGLSSNSLIKSTTHLITNTTMSLKYEKAAARNMKIMSENWVFDMWNLSKIDDDDSYRTDEFYQKYKFPIFHNLVITSSGITAANKNEIAKLINKNGGTYNESFKSKVTNILITQPNQKDSEKFKAAVNCRKECLMVDWVKDSVSKGYMLPFVNYRVHTGHETTSALTAMKKLPPKQSNYKTVLNAIDIGLVKNAKGCLDGCTIWLCGFDASDTDKLKKIINIGGGTRIDEHGPDVEYVIVGKPNTAELTYLKSLDESNVVTMNWLAACINAKRCADPTEFIYKLQASISDSVQTVPSPASRKNIEDMSPYERFRYMSRMLNVNDDDEVIKKRNEKTLLDQYSLPAIVKEVNVQREETNVCSETDEESHQIDPNLFRGVIFALFAFSEESTQELLTEIEEAGGKTVDVNDFSKTVDYLIVPSDSYDIGECGYKAKEIVTELWIHECLDGNALVDIKYYHRAIIIEENCKPLSGLTIVFSTFTTPERDFLHSLAQALGGVVNDRYMRRQNPILVCPTPLGKKYFGAVEWNLPVVTCEWLRECLKQRAKVPMEKYVLVDPRRAEKENSSDNDGSEQTQKFENPNVEVPKPPSSMPFVEYFKRVWRTYLGDDNPDTPSPVESTKKKPKKNHEDNATAGQEKPSGDGATQVINFIREVEDIKNRPSTQQMLTHDLPTNEEENPKEHHEQHNDEQMKRFSLGATTFDDELQQKIETLGGTVCEESSAFDPSCTHLICLELNSSEKTFSVIASGRWLLCPAYIEESFAAGRFLNEEEYEWGNPKAASKLPNEINEKTNNIARMNYKWRMELKLRSEKENRKVGIFSGIRAILHTNRKDSFKRLIEAGCGVVVDLKQPYTKQKDFQGITHCFVDRRMGQMSSAEKDALKAAGVHIVTMLYIQACVDQDVMPNVKDFAVR